MNGQAYLIFINKLIEYVYEKACLMYIVRLNQYMSDLSNMYC